MGGYQASWTMSLWGIRVLIVRNLTLTLCCGSGSLRVDIVGMISVSFRHSNRYLIPKGYMRADGILH